MTSLTGPVSINKAHPVNEYTFEINTVTGKYILILREALFKIGNPSLNLLVDAPILRNKGSSGQAQKAKSIVEPYSMGLPQ